MKTKAKRVKSGLQVRDGPQTSVLDKPRPWVTEGTQRFGIQAKHMMIYPLQTELTCAMKSRLGTPLKRALPKDLWIVVNLV